MSVGDTHRIVEVIRKISEVALIGVLSMLLLLDIFMASEHYAHWLCVLSGLIALAAVMLRRRFRTAGFMITLVVSVAVSLLLGMTTVTGGPGLAETGAIGVLTIGVLRWVEPIRKAIIYAVLAMIVLQISAASRLGAGGPAISLAFGFLLFVGWAAAASIGGYLRFQQERRRAAVSSVRRAERLELARELHDLVAHHITGIVVQAQAAKTVAEQKPEAVVPALEAIANAGADALTSMRRLVGVLRADDEAARTPGTSLRDLRLLAERFSENGPRVAFDIGMGVDESRMAPEVTTTLYRVLQESLTNVRRHAPTAGWVEVDLHHVGQWLRLRVRNYGSAVDTKTSRLGGGFGLVGMAERVEALGGRLIAGRTPEGAWQVLAEIPL
ncbi:Signal transduction histidine kinase [Sinosporangium album]|uniref:histidine kinase n=1 Tax=Sinosporangium album TaxID=504805 RepID=A0A1G8AL60_9ACTN|nr:histidine kinase [Sinosporangium album]SDH21599.1 Signal transduction histidine kinase [Sinosporangium album]